MNDMMQRHPVVSHDEWITARQALLNKEKEFTRLRDELSQQRRHLLWERVDKGADSEEKHEPVSDIDTAAADSLKVLDPKQPIREADIAPRIYEYTL